MRLLRCARKDGRGRRPLRLLRFARKDERGRRPLRLLRDEAISLWPRGPLRLLRFARKDERGKTPSGCFAPLATTKRGVIARAFFVCHCEECNDEAISLWPRGPLRLLRCARNDKIGGLLRCARNDERGRPPQVASLRSQRQNWGFASLRSQRRKAKEAPQVASLCSQRQKRGVIARSEATKQSQGLLNGFESG